MWTETLLKLSDDKRCSTTRHLTVLFNPRSCPEGVVVNGQLIGSKQVHKSKLRTYFGAISVYYQPDGVSLTVNTDSIIMTDGRNNHSFTWGSTAEISQDG